MVCGCKVRAVLLVVAFVTLLMAAALFILAIKFDQLFMQLLYKVSSCVCVCVCMCVINSHSRALSMIY